VAEQREPMKRRLALKIAKLSIDPHEVESRDNLLPELDDRYWA
jgi:hypothetical protein